MDVNPDKLNAFMGKMLGDVGAAMNASLMLIGDKLGLYKTLAAKGPLTSTELAQATKTSERYIREWLAAQAASGYVDYDAASGKFSMTPEQTLVFGDEDSPVFMGAVGDLVAATFLDEPAKTSDAFKTGKGVGWNRRSECLFCGTAGFFRTGYKHHLVQEWLPALDGVVEKLKRRRQGRRRRLQDSWRVDALDGRGVSKLALRRIRPSPGFDRGRTSGGKAGGAWRSRAFRSADRQILPRGGL